LIGDFLEVVDDMIQRKINIMRLQETKGVGEKGTEPDTARVNLWCTLRNLEVMTKLVLMGESGGSKNLGLNFTVKITLETNNIIN